MRELIYHTWKTMQHFCQKQIQFLAWAFFVIFFIFSPIASAADTIPIPAHALRKGPTATVTHVGYGGSFDLSDGHRVRLLGLKVPKPNIPPFQADAEPLGAEAKAFVEAFVKGHTVTLYFDTVDQDRYERWLAHVVRDDGIWLQKALLEAGLARVYSFPDNRWNLRGLLSIEAKARHQNRGLWADPYYTIKTPKNLSQHLNSYQIIEGYVTSQSSGRGTIYLNFGQRWKTDTTARITKKNKKFFTEDGPLLDYSGKTIQFRGWVFEKNGPMIDLSHPEQIQILKP